MKLYSIAFTVLVSLILASCAERAQMPGKGFEGTITEVIHVPGIADMMSRHGSDSGEVNSAPQGLQFLGALAFTVKMYVRENKVAYDAGIGAFTMHSIIDRNARTLTVLMPNHTARVIDLRAMDTMRGKMDDSLRAHTGILDSVQAMIPQPTGAKQTIHGLETEEYRASSNGMETDLWLSSNEKVKAFEVMRDAFLGRGTEGMGPLDQVFGMIRPVAGKIPVKFETKFHGNPFANGEMTDITEEKLDDGLFEIPKGYEIVGPDSTPSPKIEKKERHFTAP